MQSFWQDFRYALRQLRQAPGFTLTAVLTLALGIGVTTTVFSVVRQVLLSPLPYNEPQQLVGIGFYFAESGPNARETGNSATYIMRNNRSFSSATLLDGFAAAANLSGSGGHASSIAVLGVSQGYFNTLGAHPALGRVVSAGEDTPHGPQALVLSYGLWQRAFGGDPSIVGKTVRLNQEQISVVGVMPKSFRAETSTLGGELVVPDAWRALQAGPKDPGWDGTNYAMYARLRPGVTLAQAQAELKALEPGFYAQNPEYRQWKNDGGEQPSFRIAPLAAVVAGDVHDSLLVMSWASAAVLLLACLNLAGLNTARALRRAPEFALRAALGARRGRLVRLALLENAAVSIAGVVGAVALVQMLLPFLLKASPVPIPQLNGVAGVGAVALRAATIGLCGAVVFSAPLALVAMRQGRSVAYGRSRTSGSTAREMRTGQVIIALQISLAVVLVSVASLLLGTFLKLRAQPLGFRPDKLVVFQANLKGDHYASTQATAAFVNKVLGRLRQSPGVASVAAASGLPLDSGLNAGAWPDSRSQLKQTVQVHAVTPQYFQTMSIPVLAGRPLGDGDAASTMPAAVISAATARKWWPHASPIGAQVSTGKMVFRIVGIAADVPNASLAEAPVVTLYVPMAQLGDDFMSMLNGWFATSFSVRLSAGIHAAGIVQSAVASADPEIPVAKLTTMQEMIDSSVAAPRFFTQLAEGFAAFGLLLTAIGLFGLLSYQVTQRRREIGIRMALGATRERILAGVLTSSGRLALAGGIAGAAAARLLQPLLTHWVTENVVVGTEGSRTLLFNSSAAICLSIAALAVVTLSAALVPARRASRVEPVEALRAE